MRQRKFKIDFTWDSNHPKTAEGKAMFLWAIHNEVKKQSTPGYDTEDLSDEEIQALIFFQSLRSHNDHLGAADRFDWSVIAHLYRRGLLVKRYWKDGFVMLWDEYCETVISPDDKEHREKMHLGYVAIYELTKPALDWLLSHVKVKQQ